MFDIDTAEIGDEVPDGAVGENWPGGDIIEFHENDSGWRIGLTYHVEDGVTITAPRLLLSRDVRHLQ